MHCGINVAVSASWRWTPTINGLHSISTIGIDNVSFDKAGGDGFKNRWVKLWNVQTKKSRDVSSNKVLHKKHILNSRSPCEGVSIATREWKPESADWKRFRLFLRGGDWRLRWEKLQLISFMPIADEETPVSTQKPGCWSHLELATNARREKSACARETKGGF